MKNMPVLDMPLEELKKYRGTTPKPIDFDEFWDGELEKIHRFDGKYEVMRQQYAAEGIIVEELNFYAPDGSCINARITRPDRKGKFPVVFNFHGKSGDIGPVCATFHWNALGFAAVSMNCRSQMGKSDDRGYRGLLGQTGLIVRGLSEGRENLYYKDVFLDIVRLVDIVKSMPYCDEKRMYARGGSQGGGLSLVCAALCPQIRAIAVDYPFLSDYKRLYEMDLMANAYYELNDYLRNFCPCEGEERERMWNTLGYIDIQNFAPRVQADTLWFTGLLDPVCPPSTQFAAYNKLTCRKEMVVYTNHGHEGQWRTDDKAVQFIAGHPSVRQTM